MKVLLYHIEGSGPKPDGHWISYLPNKQNDWTGNPNGHISTYDLTINGNDVASLDSLKRKMQEEFRENNIVVSDHNAISIFWSDIEDWTAIKKYNGLLKASESWEDSVSIHKVGVFHVKPIAQ